MAAPEGAWQRAVLVAVPLGLVVLIFVTPSLIGREQPQATDIPFLLVQVTGQEWNGSVNETALLYVRSALGVPLYAYIGINVSGLGGGVDLGLSCGGDAALDGRNWTCSERYVPSIWLRLPVNDTLAVNVSATAVQDETTYRYNATFEFVWGEAAWTLRVTPEGTTAPTDRRNMFSTSMRREVAP